jgi:hypothetical protein
MNSQEQRDFTLTETHGKVESDEMKENNKVAMNKLFFYTALSCIIITAILFGGALFIYHIVMGADADFSMQPLLLVTVLTIAGFLGLMFYQTSKNKALKKNTTLEDI